MIRVVIVDTMTFSYLRGLGSLEMLRAVAAKTSKLGITKAVINQLHRSGELGPLAQSYCNRGELQHFSPRTDDEIGNEVKRVLRHDDGRLVRRNRVDVELIEVARAQKGGAVLSCENGIHVLAARRRVPTLDLPVLFAWCIREGVIDPTECGRRLLAWSRSSAAGTGAPHDWKGTLEATLNGRAGLNDFLSDLCATDPSR